MDTGWAQVKIRLAVMISLGLSTWYWDYVFSLRWTGTGTPGGIGVARWLVDCQTACQ